MAFPVVFHVFGLALPAHVVFEVLAYWVGFRLYLWLRGRTPDVYSDRQRLSVLVGAIFGAGLGSKSLGFAEHPELWALVAGHPSALLGAKTILGALLGGIVGVEVAKVIAGIRGSTGDLYVFPLLVAILIGRIGCLLTGVSDGTWGDATHLWLGFDAGDGVIRHPTPLYEMMFLGVLGIALLLIHTPSSPKALGLGKGDRPPELLRGARAALERLKDGDRFKIFVMAYCAWRFVIEFLKPVTTYSLDAHLNIVQNLATTESLRAAPGLSLLQMAALGGLMAYAAVFLRRWWRGRHGGA